MVWGVGVAVERSVLVLGGGGCARRWCRGRELLLRAQLSHLVWLYDMLGNGFAPHMGRLCDLVV